MIEQAKKQWKGGSKDLNQTRATLSTRMKTQWVVSDMLGLLRKLPDASVDCIISIASLQHVMTQEERQLVWLHSYRVLKYGGSFISTNRSYSDWFLQNYTKEQLKAIVRMCSTFGKRSRNDLIIPRKDPQRQENNKVRQRYYHIFTLRQLQQLSTASSFVVEKLGYIHQDGSYSTRNWRQSRNSLLIAKKGVGK
jgi:ubiquinone/menaquinone biosynthesis C-methylase UbiE